MYGIKLINPIDTDNKVIPYFEWDDYVSNYYTFIEEVVKVGRKYYVKQIKPILNHFNYVHIGCEILSTSKRIMNEVMCLAEDLNLNMFYQDTDSIHIVYEDVEVLAKAFEEKYNKTLQGEDMGQFHIDFDIIDDNGEKIKGLEEICSTENYFIGKKIYDDKLLGVYANGETVTGDHIRLKSIPTSCVKYQTGLTNTTPLDMYKHFYDGGAITFDLAEIILNQYLNTKRTNQLNQNIKQWITKRTAQLNILYLMTALKGHNILIRILLFFAYI